MSDDQWDLKLKTFLKKTGAELKRAGQDMKAEAERLLAEVKDPDKQQQIKAGLKDLGTWATRTAQDLAVLVESGVKKAETAVRTAVDTPTATPTPADTPPPAPTEPLRHDTPVDSPAAAAPAPARKSIGKKKGSSSKPKATGAKKTIGKK